MNDDYCFKCGEEFGDNVLIYFINGNRACYDCYEEYLLAKKADGNEILEVD